MMEAEEKILRENITKIFKSSDHTEARVIVTIMDL